ncbi:MAG: FAD-linked oxidase C-terminal domain-containing protein, partial [Rhizobiaceae bacterium]
PYLRESLMARGLGVDTYETVAPWSALAGLHGAVKAALVLAARETGSPAVVMCHLSHSYRDSACLYFTAVFVRAGDPLAQWRALKHAATTAMLKTGGAVSHHHGMGADHAPYVDRPADGAPDLLAALARSLDPGRVMATGMGAAIGA